MQISEQGAAMRRARQRAGLSLRKLSARAGVTRQAISLLERGRREGNLSAVIPLADALGLSLDEYLGRTAPEHKMTETEALEICKIALRVFAAECLAETEALPARTREAKTDAEDAAITSKKIELNEWLYKAQYSKEHYGGWSLYPERVLELTPIE